MSLNQYSRNAVYNEQSNRKRVYYYYTSDTACLLFFSRSNLPVSIQIAAEHRI